MPYLAIYAGRRRLVLSKRAEGSPDEPVEVVAAEAIASEGVGPGIACDHRRATGSVIIEQINTIGELAARVGWAREARVAS